MPSDKLSATRTFSYESGTGSWITAIEKKMVCMSPFAQAFRFSLAALLTFQLIVIPQYILDINISRNAIVVFALIVLGGLSHTSVRLYRKHFTTDDRVRYPLYGDW